MSAINNDHPEYELDRSGFITRSKWRRFVDSVRALYRARIDEHTDEIGDAVVRALEDSRELHVTVPADELGAYIRIDADAPDVYHVNPIPVVLSSKCTITLPAADFTDPRLALDYARGFIM